MPKTLFKQSLKRLPLGPEYLPETVGLSLGLKDKAGNSITLYRQDYYSLKRGICVLKGLTALETRHFSLEKFIKANKMSLSDVIALADKINQREINKHPIQFIKYFSPQALATLELDPILTDFNDLGPVVRAGMPLEKNVHQNCVVMVSNSTGTSIYAHPKVRADIENDVIGVNHVSLAPQSKEVESKSTHVVVNFAGSFVHDVVNVDEEKEVWVKTWIVENSSGHYSTRPLQMKNFLIELKNRNINLDNLYVRLYTLNIKDVNGQDMAELVEKANDFISRSDESLKNLKGCFLRIRQELPEDLSKYRNSFIYVKTKDVQKLFYVQLNMSCREEDIVDYSLIDEVVTNNPGKSKIYLNMEQIKAVIIENGGQNLEQAPLESKCTFT